MLRKTNDSRVGGQSMIERRMLGRTSLRRQQRGQWKEVRERGNGGLERWFGEVMGLAGGAPGQN